MQLTSDWKTLQVSQLGVSGSYPNNLYLLKKSSKSPNIYAKWLPSLDEEWRSNEGRGGNGKRVPLEVSLGTEDVHVAIKNAIAWSRQLKTASKEVGFSQLHKRYSLHHYWEVWFARESLKPRRTPLKWRREQKLLWEGVTGIKHQPWSKKCIEEITALDMEDYWMVFDLRATDQKNMAGAKAQHKTLINHLFKEARKSKDFPNLNGLIFPSISRISKSVPSFSRSEWDALLNGVIELSSGAAKRDLTKREYQALDWKSSNLSNKRNWVDLYDALLFQWFYYLRAEDMCRLKSDWFTDNGNNQIRCFLEETKGYREKFETYAFRPEHYQSIQRILKRKPDGYITLPWMKRQAGREAESRCNKNLNILLKRAIENFVPNFSCDARCWTTIRHTAFRLTLQEVPELGTQEYIDRFARNGHTSADQLRKTYLKIFQGEEMLVRFKDQFRPSNWSLQGRIKVA